MQPTCDGDCVSDVIAYKTAQIYQPTSQILVICRPWDAIYITVFEMYIRGFIQIKAWFSILHKSPLLPVFLHQRLISDPVWTQNQHTSLRADAVTSPPISEARAYVCRSSTPAASATVRAPNLASSCRDTVSEDDRKSFGCGGRLFSRASCHMESQVNMHMHPYPDMRPPPHPPPPHIFPSFDRSKLRQLLESCLKKWRIVPAFQRTQLLQSFPASGVSV